MEIWGRAHPALIQRWRATVASHWHPRSMRFAAFSMAAMLPSPQAIRGLTACRHLRKFCTTRRLHWFCRISVTHGVTGAAWLPRFRLTEAGKVLNKALFRCTNLSTLIACSAYCGEKAEYLAIRIVNSFGAGRFMAARPALF